MSDPKYLFVYGSLKAGFKNPFVEYIDNFTKNIGEGSIPGLMYLIDWYPGVHHIEDSPSKIQGEVLEILNTDILHSLDEYEGIQNDPNDFYVRKTVKVKMTESNQHLKCWYYEYIGTTNQKKLIESGQFEG